MRLARSSRSISTCRKFYDRLLRFLTVATLAGTIMGCQSPSVPNASAAAAVSTPEQIEQQNLRMFIARFQYSLKESALDANEAGVTGEVRLLVKINRKNEIVSCETRKPALAQLAGDDPRLAVLAKDACWRMIAPEVPANMFAEDDLLEIIAPLIYTPLTQSQRELMQSRYRRYAQGRFFADRTLFQSPPDSIGTATFHYQADARGNITGCIVNLDSKAARRSAFKYDTAMQSRLSEQCKQLDISQMPGFKVDEKGVSNGTAFFDYSPWMAGGA